MNEASLTFGRVNSPDICSVIFSLASESGVTRSGGPAGPTIDPCGQDRARVNLTARQAKEQDLLMSGTYGPHGSISSRSADLQLSMVSRLQVRTRLLGSTLFKLTWKVRDTPSGRPICALRASGRRTSGSGCSSWQTPQAFDAANGGEPRSMRYKGNAPSEAGNKRDPSKRGSWRGDLKDEAVLASWPSPKASNSTGAGTRGEGGENLQTAASWATPTTRDHKDGACQQQLEEGTVTVDSLLGRQVLLAGTWITPQTHDTTTRGNTMADHHHHPHDLSNQALLMDSLLGRQVLLAKVAWWSTPRANKWGVPGCTREPRATNGFWRDADWLPCIDGKARPVEPGTFPLAHGAPARVGRLRGYGNAINAEVATEFIEATLEGIA